MDLVELVKAMSVVNPRPWRTDDDNGIIDANGAPIATGTDTGDISIWRDTAELIVRAVNDVHCPTCQDRVRETTGMICQTCGRDYSSWRS